MFVPDGVYVRAYERLRRGQGSPPAAVLNDPPPPPPREVKEAPAAAPPADVWEGEEATSPAAPWERGEKGIPGAGGEHSRAWRWPDVCERILARSERGFAELAAQLVTLARQQHWQAVGFAAHSPGEGCTTVLLTLARILHRQRVRTLLIDADLDQPQLATLLGLPDVPGWQDVLSERVPLVAALAAIPDDPLAVLRCGTTHELEWDAASNRFWSVLRERFELILVDLGSARPVGCAAILRRGLDAVVTVASHRRHAVPLELPAWPGVANGPQPVALGVIETFA